MVAGASFWREISRNIEGRIEAKEFRPGNKLPTEQQFSREFMVNRHTVRRALLDLQEKGIVESFQGRGSFVLRASQPLRLTQRPRFTEAVTQSGRTPSTRTLKLDVRPAPAKVADRLGLTSRSPIIFLERLQFIDDEPTSLSTHYFSYERFPSFIKMYRARQTITQTLIDSGVPDYTRKHMLISARLPSVQEAELLGLPRHAPLLIRSYLNVDGVGQPLEFGEARRAGEIEIDYFSGVVDQDRKD